MIDGLTDPQVWAGFVTLTALEIKGTNFTAVAFNFPKGNEQD